MSVPNPTTTAPVFLLSAWSVTTTFRQKVEYWNNRQYKDTPKSRWEAHRVAAYMKVGA